MPRSNSKAPATVSTPPSDQVVGGPRDIANESDCVKSVHASTNEECKVITINTVPGSSVMKGLEKPSCGPSEPVSTLAGDRVVFLSFLEFRSASLDCSSSKLYATPIGPTRPPSRNI